MPPSSKFLNQYLRFGFSLSLRCPSNLRRTDISNRFSAISEAGAVTSYIEKEIALGAMIGPANKIDSPYVHCPPPPMLTRPKDNNKRRVILNLSHPSGNSVNDEVNRFEFDNRAFTLRLPAIDDITEAICDKTLYFLKLILLRPLGT